MKESSPVVTNELVRNAEARRLQWRIVIFALTWLPDLSRSVFTGQVQSGLAVADAINSVDRDADGVRDNEFSGIPADEGRVGFFMPSWVEGKKALGGAWGLAGVDRTTDSRLRSQDLRYVGLRIGFTGSADETAHASRRILPGGEPRRLPGRDRTRVNLATGNEIRTKGGWMEPVTQPCTWYQNSIGYSIDNPDNSDIPVGGRTVNLSYYIGNRFLVGRGVVLGADVQRWSTGWSGSDTGHAVLMKTFMQVNF